MQKQMKMTIMTLITRQTELTDFMQRASAHPFLTVDTEFLREKTYYPKLCLIQIGTPDGDAVAIDPLAKDIDLAPVLDMLANPDILKIFHAARQDLEIFYKLMGSVPAPLFDTQLAAMVCGYGEQVGYESIVMALTGQQVDKSSQFTDWSLRPLSDKQIDYALGDVTHLVEVYTKLRAELKERKRCHWLESEEAVLCAAQTYENDPRAAWKRIKIKTNKSRVLGTLQDLAAWREDKAQRKDIPRNWVMRDETLAEIALNPPPSVERLKKVRGMSADKAEGKTGKKILKIVEAAQKRPIEDCPTKEKKKQLSPTAAAAVDILKTLLKVTAARYEVAAKVIATSDDIEAIATGKNSETAPALQGWRGEIFGERALDLKAGKIAMGFKNGKIAFYPIDDTHEGL